MLVVFFLLAAFTVVDLPASPPRTCSVRHDGARRARAQTCGQTCARTSIGACRHATIRNLSVEAGHKVEPVVTCTRAGDMPSTMPIQSGNIGTVRAGI